MDKNKNYYNILGIDKNSKKSEIKKRYYKLSFEKHPDTNKDANIEEFNDITEAYRILYDEEKRKEYDLKSKWGKDYNEYYDFFDINFNYDQDKHSENLENFKKNEINNIYIEVDPNEFNGKLEYERWVKCKKCDGSGRDFNSKIEIKDKNGKVIRSFEAEDGCDFCDGTGIDENNNLCYFCNGFGKTGLKPCKSCGGEKRILGKQKINNVKLEGDKTIIKSMGHFSKDGNVGYLLIVTKN